MSTKVKILLIACIAITFGVLFRFGGLRLQVGSPQHEAMQQEFFSGHLINVTGELLVARDDDTLERWQEVIADTRSIDFRLYDFTYQPLIDLFKKLARGGTKILGIIENELYGNNSKNFQKLQKTFTGKYFIDLHSDELLRDNFMHAKTFLTDKAFIIQTANLGYPGFFRNREFFFISHDAQILQNLRDIFAKDRAGQKVKPEDIHPNVLICPIDCRHKTETIVSGAKRSIWMYQQYIVDLDILALLTGKQQTAVDIKLIIGDNSQKDVLLKTPLKGVTRVPSKPYVHAKMILVDETYLIVSSINMSANSMDENREIGIIIIDAALINKFKSQFERDRSKSQSTGHNSQ